MAEIRQRAPSCLICLIKIYIFLCEAKKHDFYSLKLQEKRNKAMIAKLTTLKGGGGMPAAAGKPTCKKCGGEAHPGRYKKCPFKNLGDAEAKKRMAQLMAALAKMTPDEVGRALMPAAMEE